MTDSRLSCIYCQSILLQAQERNGQWQTVCQACGAAGPLANSPEAAQIRWDQAHAGKRLLRSVIDESPDIILLKDWEGRFLLANKALAKLYGTTPENLIGKDDGAFNPNPEQVRFYLENIRGVIRKGETQIVQESSTDVETGEIRHYQSIKKPLTGPDGDPQVLVIAHDVTELHRIHAEIKERERRYDYAMTAAGEGIWDWDLREDVVRHNAKWAELLGLDHEIQAHPVATFASFIHEDDRDATMATLNAALTGNGEYYSQHRMCRADGRVIWAVDRGRVVERDAAGQPVRMVGAFSDITARKQMEDQMATVAIEAKAASTAKSAFLANMSHELRTPLSGILGIVDIATQRTRDPELKSLLLRATDASNYLLDLINNILDISRIEADHLKLSSADFQFGQVVDKVHTLVGKLADDRGVQLICECPESVRRQVIRGDAVRLTQVLINLCGNGIKFSAEGGKVVFTVSVLAETPEQVRWRFRISDNGIGIAPEDHEKIFNVFEQGDNSMTRRYGGSGLGLSISQRLVGLMGGHISVHSTLGQGSRFEFTLTFPKGTGAIPDNFAPALPVEEMVTRLATLAAGSTVLLAEDELVNQLILKQQLERIGLIVDVADNGVDALSLAVNRHYAVILMDVQMPRLNGLDATRAIRAGSSNQETPIFGTTANAFEEDRKACLEAGMTIHLAKPIKPEVLYANLLRHLVAPD